MYWPLVEIKEEHLGIWVARSTHSGVRRDAASLGQSRRFEVSYSTLPVS